MNDLQIAGTQEVGESATRSGMPARGDSAKESHLVSASATDERPAGISGSARGQLTEQQRQVLDFENRWANRVLHDGSKGAAIVEEFGLSTIAYYQVLNRLLDLEAALAYDPVLVYRLRRIRDDRMARMSSSSAVSS